MTLFAIGDLHLPGGEEKPMDIFGDHWENHFAHIAADWRARVKDGDVVLIPGDISWAMQLGARRAGLAEDWRAAGAQGAHQGQSRLLVEQCLQTAAGAAGRHERLGSTTRWIWGILSSAARAGGCSPRRRAACAGG